MAPHLSRRDLMRWAVMGGIGTPTLAALAACASSSDTSRVASSIATTSSTTPTGVPVGTAVPGSTLPVDRSVPWWLQGNYAPVQREVSATDLVVRGTLPLGLDGLYVKNGSNPPAANSPHWFFGDGMVHGLRLGDGRAQSYRNRYVATTPHLAGNGFGQGPPGADNNQSNVSCIWHGGSLLTSGEVGAPYRLDPSDLSTIGVFDYGGVLPSSFTAHPKIDPDTGRMHAFGYAFDAPYLWYYIVEPDGTMSHAEPIDLPAPTMMHDFAITATDVVFWDLPVVFDLALAVQFLTDPTIIPYVWKPELGARIGVMPLAGGADRLQWFDIEPCYVFHSVNAYREADSVTVDVCRLSSMFASDNPGLGGEASLRRWTIDTARRTVRDEVLETDDPGDLPGRHPALVGRKHRYGYLTGTRPDPDTVDLGGIIRHDFERGTRTTWDPGSTRHATEPLFVPDPDSPATDPDERGWLLTFVHDDAVDETVLAVLAPSAVDAGPVAEIVLPQRVPYGFHATFVPST